MKGNVNSLVVQSLQKSEYAMRFIQLVDFMIANCSYPPDTIGAEKKTLRDKHFLGLLRNKLIQGLNKDKDALVDILEDSLEENDELVW